VFVRTATVAHYNLAMLVSRDYVSFKHGGLVGLPTINYRGEGWIICRYTSYNNMYHFYVSTTLYVVRTIRTVHNVTYSILGIIVSDTCD
jgi:hypothetical protein